MLTAIGQLRLLTTGNLRLYEDGGILDSQTTDTQFFGDADCFSASLALGA